MAPRKKTLDKAPKKPRNVAAKNLADPRYRHKVEKNPAAYTRKAKHKPGKGALRAPGSVGTGD